MDHSFAIPNIDIDLSLSPDWPSWFARHARLIQAGVCVAGEPAAYALVWEWGNERQTQKGPRTVLGTNPAGQRAWLSSQAPHGWIATHEPEMWNIINNVLDNIHFQGNTEDHMDAVLESASRTISSQMLRLLKSTVPVDSGDLDSALEIVEPGDSLLDEIEDSFRQMPDGTTDSGTLLIDMSFEGPLNR